MIQIPNEVTRMIDKCLSEKEYVLLAIDGSCTAGKTTLAAALADMYDCNTIHMDDFFLRPEQRTQARFSEPGGNVDYERFRQEVLDPLKKGIPFSYRPFHCKTMTLGEPVQIIPKRLTIIEGTYSHHPYFQDPYDLKLCLTVSPELRRSRIRQRPIHLQQKFHDLWIPLEQAYFQAFSIEANADLIL